MDESFTRGFASIVSGPLPPQQASPAVKKANEEVKICHNFITIVTRFRVIPRYGKIRYIIVI
jgi:hypothetical protein